MDDSFLSRLRSNTLYMKSETGSRGAVKNLLVTDPCYPPPSCSQVISHLMWRVHSLFWVRNVRYCTENWMLACFVAHPLWSGSVLFLYEWLPSHLMSDPPEWAYSAFLFRCPEHRNCQRMSRRMQAFCAPKPLYCSGCGDNENPVSFTFVTEDGNIMFQIRFVLSRMLEINRLKQRTDVVEVQCAVVRKLQNLLRSMKHTVGFCK
jgi:hypothetical protein